MHIKKIYRNEGRPAKRHPRKQRSEFLDDLRHFAEGLGQVYYKEYEDEIFDGGANVISFTDFESVKQNRADAIKAKAALKAELSDWVGWSAEVDDDGDYAYLTITVE